VQCLLRHRHGGAGEGAAPSSGATVGAIMSKIRYDPRVTYLHDLLDWAAPPPAPVPVLQAAAAVAAAAAPGAPAAAAADDDAAAAPAAAAAAPAAAAADDAAAAYLPAAYEPQEYDV
jgi:hypothetical protein